MNRLVYYCKSWFRARKRVTEIWSEEQARKAYSSKQTYTALIDSAERPYCFLEIADGVVCVGFLDEFLRESLTYAFQETAPGILFLSMATHREFESDTDKVAGGTTYMFETDGSIIIRREYFNPHRVETAESKADVSKNYSPSPEFGEYDDLIRADRG